MPVSSHLLRKLQESLGHDAAADLATMLESMDAIRADIAELRHQMEIQLARLNARLDATVTKADLDHALLIQTRWMLGGLVLVLTAILFKG